MSMPSRAEVTARLTEKLDYPPPGAQLVADKIERLHSDLREPFELWWNTGEVPTVEVEGYTVARLMTDHGLKPLAALLTLDWLLREPETAQATIARGHDRIDTT
jgi:hypothetical protein